MLLPYLQLIRAPNGITAITNILAAVCVASVMHSGVMIGADAIDWLSVVLLCLASLCFYYAGMALNDCLDFTEDSQERPSRPLPSGKVPLVFAKALVVGLFVLGLTLSAWVSRVSFYFALVLLVCIVLYDAFIKEGLQGALAMAACRYANWLLGFSILPIGASSWFIPLPVLFYIAALTFLSKQETSAEKPSAVYVAAGFLVLTLVSLLNVMWILGAFEKGWQTLLYVLAALGFMVMVFYRLKAVLADFRPQNIEAMIKWMIIGIIPLDALIVLVSGHMVIAALLLLLIWPCRYLSRFIYMT